MGSRQEKLRSLLRLNQHSYHIEFKGYLANHLSHGLIALYGLGASEEQMQHYFDHYTARVALEPRIQKKESLSENNLLDHRSDITYYESYFEFFEREIAERGTLQTLQKYLPLVAEGLGCAALHATIDIGFGIEAGDQGEVGRGLAHLFSKYFSLGKISLEDGKDAIAKLESVGSEDFISRTTAQLVGILKQVHDDSTFQDIFPSDLGLLKKLKILSEKYSDSLKSYDIGIELDNSSDIGPVLKLFEILTVQLFAATGCKDFFLLHGVTGMWALKNIILALNAAQTLELQKTLIAYFWRTYVAVYITQGRPPVTMEALEEFQEDTSVSYKPEQWEDITEKALRTVDDTHLIKIVHVNKELSKLFGGYSKLFLKVAEETFNVVRAHKTVFSGVG